MEHQLERSRATTFGTKDFEEQLMNLTIELQRQTNAKTELQSMLAMIRDERLGQDNKV